MKIGCSVLVAAVAAVFPQLPFAATPPQGVCDALNSARDHQDVVIHAEIASTRHGTFLFEGTGSDPCPGWPKHFFTGPSSIPILLASYAGVHVPEKLHRENIEFVIHLRGLQRTSPSVRHMVTASGVLIRTRWPLLRGFKGIYCCWGEGLDGGSLAVLVPTSTPIEDR